MRIVLATCRSKPSLTPSDGLLAAELERRGAAVVAAPWDEVNPAEDGRGVVCLRSTWDYHTRWAEFRGWIARFASRRLWNPAETVLWNADKLYLRELEASGITLPATRWLDTGERPDVGSVLRAWGAVRGILKPRVSATAYGTYLVHPERRLDEAEWAPLDGAGGLLQEFVPEVESRGEISLVHVDGAFSHAVRKRPASGDFRVQGEFGGRWEATHPSHAARTFGEAVLAAVSRPWLYARVDLVEAARGPVLMELELIEPELFFTARGGARGAARLAAALLVRARTRS